MPNDDFEDFLFGAGGKAAFGQGSEIGARCSGTVLDFTIANQTDVDTGAPRTFNDGTPMRQAIVTLQTDDREDDDDDGIRRFYAKKLGNFVVAKGTGKPAAEALAEALQAVGVKVPAIGGELVIEQTGFTVPKKAGKSQSKLYRIRYTAPAFAGSIDDL